MAKKSSVKAHKIPVASAASAPGKVRQTAEHLLELGRDAVSKAKASAIAWIISKKPQSLTPDPLPRVRHKTRRPRMAHKTTRKSPSKR